MFVFLPELSRSLQAIFPSIPTLFLLFSVFSVLTWRTVSNAAGQPKDCHLPHDSLFKDINTYVTLIPISTEERESDLSPVFKYNSVSNVMR